MKLAGMVRRTIPLLFFFYTINAQIALPTFQGVHKTHTTVVAESDSQTFSYTGAQQTFTVSSGVNTITIKAWGAQGGQYNSSWGAGKGGYSTGTLSVTSGQVLYIYAGGQGNSSSSSARVDGGFNGGGYTWGRIGNSYAAGAGGGGGSSYIGGVSSSETIAGNASMPDPDGWHNDWSRW